MTAQEIEYNNMAVDCFKQIATNLIRDCYTPEEDEPIWHYTIVELCEEVYKQGVNDEKAVYGPHMRPLYVPKALRYQGKTILRMHVEYAVIFAIMQWKMDGNQADFLSDGEWGAGIRAREWAQEVA